MLSISRIAIGVCSVLMLQEPQVTVSVRTDEDRMNAAELLESGKLDPETERRTITSLADFLNPSDGRDILYAFQKCAKRGPGCLDAVVPQIVNSVKFTKDETFFCLLCDTLLCCEKITPQSRDLLAAQFERRQDLIYGIYKLAAVLAKFGQDDKLDWLSAKLKRPFSLPVCCAAEALGSLGPRAKSTIPALEPLLAARAPDVRVVAATALWRIGYKDKRDVIEKVLRESLAEDDEEVTFVPTYHGSVPAASHSDIAINWLWKIGDQSAETTDLLASMLRDSSRDRKLHLIWVLAKIGKPTESVLAALREASVDQMNALVAKAAQRALQTLGQD